MKSARAALCRDLQHALDPVVWAREVLWIELDPWQQRLLRMRSRRSLVNVTRQGGKSRCTAVGVLHEGNYVARSKTVIISPSQRQSSLLLASIEELAAIARVPLRPLPGEDPGFRMPLGDVIALPGAEATTRGFGGVSWLIIDEASRVSDDLFYSVRAFLATTNGRISLLSTPFGKRGFFYREHEAGRWEVTRVPAMLCPRITPEFLEEQRESMPESWFRQEYCCEFTSVDGAVFDHDLVLGSLSSEVKPLCL